MTQKLGVDSLSWHGPDSKMQCCILIIANKKTIFAGECLVKLFADYRLLI